MYGELMAMQKLMHSCHGLTGAWLTVRGDCTFAGGASFLTCGPGGEQIWPLVSNIHRDKISMFERQNHASFVHVKAHDNLWNGEADLLAKGERS